MRRHLTLLALSLLPLTGHAVQPLFDAHLHYDAGHARLHGPADIVSVLARHDIARAVVTASPPHQVLALHALAPGRIVPILGVYRSSADKADWWRDATLPDRVAAQLAAGPWRGIGELHLFAAARHSPVLRQLVGLAVERRLPLLIHSDPAVIDALFEDAPSAQVIWAHAGAYPHPDLLRDYLARYPGLSIDLSVRDERIAPGGVLHPDWTWLLMAHSDRFMVGVDTYRAERWDDYGQVVTAIRHWLSQLPDEVATAIGHDNAARLFDATARPPLAAQPKPRAR